MNLPSRINRLEPSKKLTGIDWFLILAGGLVVGFGLVTASAMETKWMAFLVVSLICLSGVIIIRERERFFLYLSVIFLPIQLDFHLVFYRPLLYRPVNGLVISAFDIPFFFLIVAWLSRLLLHADRRVQFHAWFTYPYLALIAWAIIGINRTTAPPIIDLWSIWLLLKNWLIFLYIANNVRSRRMIYTLVALFLSTLVIQDLFGLAQRFAGGLLGAEIFGERASGFFEMRAGMGTVSRVGGTLGHPNRLAAYLGLWIPVGTALLFAPIKGRYKALLTAVLALTGLVEVLTFSRGGWVGLGIGGVITLFLCLSRIIKSRLVAAVLVTALVIITVISSLALIEPMRRRLFEDDYGAARTRIPLAIVSFNVITNNPWMGVGLGDYTHQAVAYDNTLEAIYRLFPHPVHNAFLLIAGELGLPGLGLFLFILIGVYVLLIRTAHAARGDPVLPFLCYGLIGGLTAWFLHHQIDWEYTLLLVRYWFVFGLIQAMFNVSHRKEER